MANNSMVGITPLSMDQHIPYQEYTADDSERILAIWKKRIAQFYPELVSHIDEYHMRYSIKGRRKWPRSCVLLMDDDSLKEFSMSESGFGELRDIL